MIINWSMMNAIINNPLLDKLIVTTSERIFK